MRSHNLLTFFACVSALRLEPSAVPFVARLHLLDSCVTSAFSKEPDTVTSSSARATAGTAVLSSGKCYATPGSGSVSFSVRQVRSDVGASGRGAAFKLVAVLERYSGAACDERISRRTLPPSAHRVCTPMPSASALANEAWFLLEISPHAALDEPAAAAVEAAPTVGSSSGFTFNAPAGGSSGPFSSSGSKPDGFFKFPGPVPTTGSRGFPKFPSSDRWEPKDPKRVFDDFLAEEARERQRQQRERDAAAEADRQAPTPTRSAAYTSLGDAWKADLASFQMDRLGLVTCALIGVVAMGYSWRRTKTTR
jgi:hypothetical protein